MPKNRRIINLGIYRSGSTTLSEASRELNLHVFRQSPEHDASTLRGMLFHPEIHVRSWWEQGGREDTVRSLITNHVLYDGWYALMVFLPPESLLQAQALAMISGLELIYVCTQRESTDDTVLSELHHWVRHNLERRCNLSSSERANLSSSLEIRATQHKARIQHLGNTTIKCHVLPLNANYPPRIQWASILSKIFRASQDNWSNAFDVVGKANKNPPLPVEGILVTLRVGNGEDALSKRRSVNEMLTALEKDMLCTYFVTLALDADEFHTPEAAALLKVINAHRIRQARDCVVVVNDEYTKGRFPICKVWDTMASTAWQCGADWVVLLGDDIDIMTECHYRCTYRAFLDISEKLECAMFFGCPWWNDQSFPGFPTFPVVGKIHKQIFGSLIPNDRVECFFSQDLDPYLQRLYLSHSAAPPMEHAVLRNRTGGNHDSVPRYQRIPAHGWKDFCLVDVERISAFLGPPTNKIIDIGIPTYRVDLEYLTRLCQLPVPQNWRSCFLVIVDNPILLLKSGICGQDVSLMQAERRLEELLRMESKGENNIRVRVNHANSGASASRNRAIFESSAEYIVFLDDDVIPAGDLLFQYDAALSQRRKEITFCNANNRDKANPEILGLIGMVRFPRSPTLPIIHAGVLMSYLTFMFEIAICPTYQNPAWGVTANILVKRRSTILFDTNYAKSGGGEDVDFCLQLGQSNPEQGLFYTAPLAMVEHPFWQGNLWNLCIHFFHWAIGDSALFHRFPQHTFRSSPNATEMMTLTAVLILLLSWLACHLQMDNNINRSEDQIWQLSIANLIVTFAYYIAIDIGVDLWDHQDRKHRNQSLGPWPRSGVFLLGCHCLAHFYVIVLEYGRLWGHFKRGYLLRYFGQRFDWHCGQLVHHRRNIRTKERKKFVLFLPVLLVSIHSFMKILLSSFGMHSSTD